MSLGSAIYGFLTRARSLVLWGQFRKVATGAPQASASPKRILVWPFRAFDVTLATESVIAEALRLRGHDVHTAFCRGLVDQCENMQWGDDRKAICARCKFSTAAAMRSQPNAPGIDMSRYVTAAERAEAGAIPRAMSISECIAFQKDGVPVGEIAHSSALRYLLKGRLDEEDADILRTYVKNALIVLAASQRILDEFKPDQVLTSHGIYNSWGIISALCRTRGIGLVVWAQGYRKNSAMFVRGDTYHRVLPLEPASKWEGHGISKAQRDELLAYIHSKRGGSRDQWAYNAGFVDDTARVRQQLGLDASKRTVLMFTNVAWDAATLGQSRLFADQVDWLAQTTRFAVTNPDLQVVIRIHPAELQHHHQSRQPMADQLDALFPAGYPPNVILVRPNENISSYALADLADLAVVFGTKLGLELAVGGLKTVVVGTPLYGFKGFTADPATLEEYFGLLEGSVGDATPGQEEIERAISFADYYYNHLHYDISAVRMRFASDTSSVIERLRPPVSLATDLKSLLQPDGDAALDEICRRIADDEDFGLRVL